MSENLDKIELLRSLKSAEMERADEIESSSLSIKNFSFLSVGALVGFLIASGLYFFLPEQEVEVAKAAPEESLDPQPADASSGLVASGYVIARNQATVAAEVTGRLKDLRFEEGQEVQKGQILATLDRTNIDGELRASRARLKSAQASVDIPRSELAEAIRIDERGRSLAERGFITKAELTRNATNVASLRAQVERGLADVETARADIGRIQIQAERYVIRAPFSGVVVGKNAQAGEIISPVSAGGGFTRTGICTLVDMQSLEIEVDVSEQYIDRVRPGQKVIAELDSIRGTKFPAKVIAIVPTANRAKSTVRVRIGFDDLDSQILPDMSVKVTFEDLQDNG